MHSPNPLYTKFPSTKEYHYSICFFPFPFSLRLWCVWYLFVVVRVCVSVCVYYTILPLCLSANLARAHTGYKIVPTFTVIPLAAFCSVLKEKKSSPDYVKVMIPYYIATIVRSL